MESKDLIFVIKLFLPLKQYWNGGLQVLHKLAYEIANRGYTTYIFTNPYYPHNNIKTIKSTLKSQEWVSNNFEHFNFNLPQLDYTKVVGIYDENQKSDPLNLNNLTRWILYDTNPNIENTWSDSDVIFNYGNFKTSYNSYKNLTITDLDISKFYSKNQSRNGFCYILHKNTPQNVEEYLKPFNATNLTGWQNKGYDYLQEELNKYEYLISFDHITINSIIALLCGTKVINLNPTTSPEDYRKNNILQQFGLAHGLPDITHANNTINLARDHITNHILLQNQTIDNFIKFWEQELL
jgi:hypothetical protein